VVFPQQSLIPGQWSIAWRPAIVCIVQEVAQTQMLDWLGVPLRVCADDIDSPVRVGLCHTEITQRDAWAIFACEAAST